MNFIAPLPKNYDPSSDRSLITANALEIENARGFPYWARDPWIQDALKRGFVFTENLASSYYFDTPDLGFYSNGITLRVRPGGEAFDANGGVVETFPNQFAVKSINRDYQAVAQAVARRIAPDRKKDGLYPIVRYEIEGEHPWPHEATQLRMKDLPDQPWCGHKISIVEAFTNLILNEKIKEVIHPEGLVLVPWVSTTVDRHRTKFYVEPGQRYDFIDLWPARKPTERMLATGKFLCLETAADECVMRACPRTMPIDAMMNLAGENFRDFQHLDKRSLLEYEAQPNKSGDKLTDAEAVACYVAFSAGIHDYANRQLAIRQSNPETRVDENAVAPTRSKATTALGLHPECCEGGRLRDVYRSGLVLAA